jgi:hypothetical protein
MMSVAAIGVLTLLLARRAFEGSPESAAAELASRNAV